MPSSSPLEPPPYFIPTIVVPVDVAERPFPRDSKKKGIEWCIAIRSGEGKRERNTVE